MLTIVNRIADCRRVNSNNRKLVVRASMSHIVLHRTDLHTFDRNANPIPVADALLDGVQVAVRFVNLGLGTGGLIPYTILVCADLPDFTVEQLLPLSIRGAHAIGYNWRSIGIAAVGDFRFVAPPAEQYAKLVELVALLLPINGGLEVAGHTSLPGAAADPNKVCPGKHLDVGRLVADARALLPAGWQQWSWDDVNKRLVDAGIVL